MKKSLDQIKIGESNNIILNMKNEYNIINENIIERYTDLKGNIIQRKIVSKISIIIFSGIKFLFDRLLAILGLIIASPLMIIIAIMIKIDSKGPVLFKQERTGKLGKKFYIYKFRTMVAKNNVHDFAVPDQHTKIGKILRKTSLDELLK